MFTFLKRKKRKTDDEDIGLRLINISNGLVAYEKVKKKQLKKLKIKFNWRKIYGG